MEARNDGSGWDIRIADVVVRWRTPLLITGLILAALATWPASSLQYDRTLENMFSPDDPLLVPYRKLQTVFDGNEIVLGVYDDTEFMNPDQSGMKRLRKIRQSLQRVPGVQGVVSLEMPVGTDVVVRDRYVHDQICSLFEGFTHGADGRSGCVACLLQPEEVSGIPRTETIAQLRECMSDLPDNLARGRITGEPVMIHDAFEFIEQDGERLFWATTVCLGLVIYWFVRSIKWVLIPLLVVQHSLLLTKGVLGLMQLRISMVSSMLTAVVTVVGIGAVMHVIVHYRQARSEGDNSWQALVRTAHELAAPIFWACLTDAIGFASLLIAYVGPVREFGLMMSIGSLMVLVSTVLLVPSLALIAGTREKATVPTDRFVTTPLLGMVRAANRHSKLVAGITIGLAVLGMTGASRLRIESDFTRNFRATSEIVKSYEIVESRFGGAGVCDVILPAPTTLDWRYLRRVLAFEARLRKDVQITGEEGKPALTKVLSLADVLYHASAVDISRSPSRRQQLLINTGLRSMRRSIPEFFGAMYAKDPDDPGTAWFRVMLRAKERQPSHQKLEIINQVERIAGQHFPDAAVTGSFVLLTNLIDSLLSDQWRSFAISILGIALVMYLALRDIRLVMIAMVPNIVPITFVMGLMGWLGLELNMGAAMIAAVSIGLSIDGSIHYLIEFVRARNGGRSVRDAIEVVQESVGKSMVYSTLALVAGFSVLASSQFVPTVYFGVLMGLSLLFTLLGTLLWLPLLLNATERVRTAIVPAAGVRQHSAHA